MKEEESKECWERFSGYDLRHHIIDNDVLIAHCRSRMRIYLLRHLAEFLAEFWRRRDTVGQKVYGENFCNVYESSKGIIGDPATTRGTNLDPGWHDWTNVRLRVAQFIGPAIKNERCLINSEMIMQV